MMCDTITCNKDATMHVVVECGEIIPNSHGNRNVTGWETNKYCNWHGKRAYNAARLGLGYGILMVERSDIKFV